MRNSSEESLPTELLAIAEQLREEKHEPSALDLDRIKMRALAKATRGSGTFAPRKGRLMKRRSFLTTALVVGVIASGTGATMAVTGQFSGARDDGPKAGAAQSQYQNCREQVRENRRSERHFKRSFQRQHRLKRRAHRRAESRARGRERRALRRINRTDERQQKRQHREDARDLREDNRDAERRCREGRSR